MAHYFLCSCLQKQNLSLHLNYAMVDRAALKGTKLRGQTPICGFLSPDPEVKAKRNYGVYHFFLGKTREKGIHHRSGKKGIHHSGLRP